MVAVLVASFIGFVLTIALTPLFIRLFVRFGWGQFIREDGPKSHSVKRGMPTMGGVVFVLTAIFAYVVAATVFGGGVSVSALLVLFMFLGMGVVGFLDDLLKVKNQRSLGLGGWQKLAGQVLVAVIFGVLALLWPNSRGQTPATAAVSFTRDTAINFDWWQWGFWAALAAWFVYLIWINLITVSAANGVNLTDGLDGLAAGAVSLTLLAYIVIGFWQFNQSCFRTNLAPENLRKCYSTTDPLDIAIVSAAVFGSLLGFLWWNTNPAKIIMGDTGSLGLGGVLAALSVVSHTELLLIVLGGLFVIEAGSVILQRAFYKRFRRRLFLMSPIHHHFELKGWAEVTIVVRFWIIAGSLVAVGLGIFYLEWISG